MARMAKMFVKISVWSTVVVYTVGLMLTFMAVWCEIHLWYTDPLLVKVAQFIAPTLPYLYAILGSIACLFALFGVCRLVEKIGVVYVRKLLSRRATYRNEARLWRICAHELRNHEKIRWAMRAERKSRRYRKLASPVYSDEFSAVILRFARVGDMMRMVGEFLVELLVY